MYHLDKLKQKIEGIQKTPHRGFINGIYFCYLTYVVWDIYPLYIFCRWQRKMLGTNTLDTSIVPKFLFFKYSISLHTFIYV